MMTLDTARVLITVQIVDDGNDILYALALVTSLFTILASVARFATYLAGWLQDISQALIFTAKTVDIIVVSLAYGMGVRL